MEHAVNKTHTHTHVHTICEILLRGRKKNGQREIHICRKRNRMCAICHVPTLVKETGSQVLGIGMK